MVTRISSYQFMAITIKNEEVTIELAFGKLSFDNDNDKKNSRSLHSHQKR